MSPSLNTDLKRSGEAYALQQQRRPMGRRRQQGRGRRRRRPGRQTRRRTSARPAARSRHRRDRPQGPGAAEGPDGRRPVRVRRRIRPGPAVRRHRQARLGADRARPRRPLGVHVVLYRPAGRAGRGADLRRVPRRLHRRSGSELRALAHRAARDRRGHAREHRGDRSGSDAQQPSRRPDADRRREHRRHHLPGRVERARSRRSSCSTSPIRARPSRPCRNWPCARSSRAASCRRS